MTTTTRPRVDLVTETTTTALWAGLVDPQTGLKAMEDQQARGSREEIETVTVTEETLAPELKKVGLVEG